MGLAERRHSPSTTCPTPTSTMATSGPRACASFWSRACSRPDMGVGCGNRLAPVAHPRSPTIAALWRYNSEDSRL